jgi:hypothetical protein
MSTDKPMETSPPGKPLTTASVGELKRALVLELQSLERQKAELEEARLRLGWRASLRYLHGSREAGYPAPTSDAALRERAQTEVAGGHDAGNPRFELHNAQAAHESVVMAVQAHNRRLQQRGFFASLIFAPLDQWRAVRLDKQAHAAQRRKETAERVFTHYAKRLEAPGRADHVTSLVVQDRQRERDMAARRQGTELRRAMLADELALRRRMLDRMIGLPEDMAVPVTHQELSAAIKDPALESWLRQAESRRG